MPEFATALVFWYNGSVNTTRRNGLRLRSPRATFGEMLVFSKLAPLTNKKWHIQKQEVQQNSDANRAQSDWA